MSLGNQGDTPLHHTSFLTPPPFNTPLPFPSRRLSKVELPPSLEVIERGAFFDCSESLSVELPDSVRTVQVAGGFRENTLSCRIRLPASLAMLSYGSDVHGLWKGVKEVTISATADLRLLVRHIEELPEHDEFGLPFLHPDVKFKVLHCGDCRSTNAPPALSEHIPQSIFSLDVAPHDLASLLAQCGEGALRNRASSLLMSNFQVLADILQCSSGSQLPDEVLHNVLPFLWGSEATNRAAFKYAITTIGKLCLPRGKPSGY